MNIATLRADCTVSDAISELKVEECCGRRMQLRLGLPKLAVSTDLADQLAATNDNWSVLSFQPGSFVE
jgi:hypothetical protein